MTRDDRMKWDRKYGASDCVMGPEPKPLAQELELALPAGGRALDIACGEGQMALYLAARGMQVDAVDISPVGLQKARAELDRAGIGERVSLIEWDLDDGLPNDCDGPYALISCLHFYDPGLIRAAIQRLEPGGQLLVEWISSDNHLLGLPAPSPRFLAPPGKLLQVASAAGMQIRFYREGVVRGRAVAQLLAAKPGGGPLFFS